MATSSRSGSGKWARMQFTAHKGKGTRNSDPKNPNTTSLTACRLCDDFFDVLNPHALCYHIAICIAAMQSTKPTHSDKLPGTQGGKLYNLGVLPDAQLRQLQDFVLDSNYFLTADVPFLTQHLLAAFTQTPSANNH